MRTSFAEALFEPVLVKYLLYWINSQRDRRRSIKLSMSPMKNNLLLTNYRGIDCYKESAKLNLISCSVDDAVHTDTSDHSRLDAKEVSDYIIQCVDKTKGRRLADGWRDLALLCGNHDHTAVSDVTCRENSNIIIKGKYKERTSRKSLLFYIILDCFQDVEKDITIAYKSVYFKMGSTKKINTQSQSWRSDGIYAECISKDLLAEVRLMDRRDTCHTPVARKEARGDSPDAIKKRAYRTQLETLVLGRRNFRYLTPIPSDQTDNSPDGKSHSSVTSKAIHSKNLCDAFLDIDEFIKGDDFVIKKPTYEQDGNVIRAQFKNK